MTDQHPENNEVLHELLRKYWHEEADPDGFCTCGAYHLPRDWDKINPDYADDPRLVLEGMRERKEEWYRFQLYLRFDNLFDLILDRTGRLRDLAIEFLREGLKNGNQ